MKLDLGPVRSYVAPSFKESGPEPAVDADLQARLWRPIKIGSIIVAVFVFGLIVWASFTPVSTGVTSQGVLRVESNRKTLRHREGGTVRAILVKDGDRVRAGQPLIRFDDVQARAAFDVLQNQNDSLLAQSARFAAESTDRPTIDFPPDLMARMSDPRVAGLIRDQQFLFTSRLQLFESQSSVLRQRMDQLQTRIDGLQTQVASIDEQVRLTQEELTGYKSLYEKGYAPKTLILRYERAVADLEGRRGSLVSDISRTREQMGETSMQAVSLREERQSQAAEGLRDMQTRIADTAPRLTAAKQTLEGTLVRSPVDGYVLNLSQFTVGGVAGPGEHLVDVVPANEALVVTAMIRPQDIEEVHVGMDARVRPSAFSQRWVNPLMAKVTAVSADRLTDDKTGQGFFRADLAIDPAELKKLGKNVRLTSGMPADVMIVTGKRTIMGFLISPITDTLNDAFREQ